MTRSFQKLIYFVLYICRHDPLYQKHFEQLRDMKYQTFEKFTIEKLMIKVIKKTYLNFPLI